MQHPYEYAIIVNNLTPAKPVDFSKEADMVSFIQQVGRFTSDLPKAVEDLEGGGWEVLSHDLAVHGRTVLLSILIRRSRR